ncbi:MAG: sulfotransferase domain-containing protein [Bacteroidetes bacterium]|nr:sulfotransferase domain-containing protein [Bacteroidota bacterium]
MVISNYNYPDFFVVGAAKSGTTTVCNYLNSHDKVFFPKNHQEPHYFSFYGQKPFYTSSQFTSKMVWQHQEYKELYSSTSVNQCLGDGSTSYLYLSDIAVKNMKLHYGKRLNQLKILVILRNPVERAISHYNYLLRNGFENLPFEQAIRPDIIEKRKKIRWGFDYLEYGNYAEQLKPYLENFNIIKVIMFDDLKNPNTICQELGSFLGFEAKIISEFPKSNPSGKPIFKGLNHLLLKNPKLKKLSNGIKPRTRIKLLEYRDKILAKSLVKAQPKPEVLHALNGYYEHQIVQLEQLLNIKTGWL